MIKLEEIKLENIKKYTHVEIAGNCRGKYEKGKDAIIWNIGGKGNCDDNHMLFPKDSCTEQMISDGFRVYARKAFHKARSSLIDIVGDKARVWLVKDFRPELS